MTPRPVNRPSANPVAVGKKVLAGLAKGRHLAIQRARDRGRHNLALILALAGVDSASGKPLRGRAGRIHRKLNGALTERSVQRILDRLSSMSDSLK